jgi:hypothetical protein
MKSSTRIDSPLAPTGVERARLRWFGAWVCVLALAFALRLGGLLSESLWIDEAYSLALAQTRAPEILSGTAADQHPPLYYLVLGAWLRLGRPLLHAQALFYLRYLSVLIGTLGVAAGVWVGRELLGEDVGLGTGLLLASSPMHIWYSQEARMYILLTLFLTLSAGMTWRLSRGNRGWPAYGLVTLLALYTHYFAAFVILAENLFVLVWLARRRVRSQSTGIGHLDRPFLVRWLSTQVALVLCFVPWLPVAVYQTRFHQMRWLAPPSALQIAATPLRMVLGDAGLGPRGGLVFAAMGLAVAWTFWRAARPGRTETWQGYAFAAGWLLVPFGAIAFLSLVYPLFQYKQMLMLLPPLLVLIAAALIRLPRLAQIVVFGAAAWVVAASLSSMYRVETKDGWREASAYLIEHSRPGDVLYLNPSASILALDVYLTRPLPYAGYPPEYDVRTGGWEGTPLTVATADREMSALTSGYRRIWLVEFGPEFWDPEGTLRAWLEGSGQRVEEQSFGRIVMTLFELTDESSG